MLCYVVVFVVMLLLYLLITSHTITKMTGRIRATGGKNNNDCLYNRYME